MQHSSQRVVRPDFVLLIERIVGDLPHFVERIEQVRAEHFLAIGSIEAPDVDVLIGFARLDEAQLDVLPAAPFRERIAR